MTLLTNLLLEQAVQKYSEDQQRDEHGRWTSEGGNALAPKGSSGNTRRERPVDPEMSKLPVGDAARVRAEQATSEGKAWIEALENNSPGFKEAREKAAWAEGRIARLEPQIKTQQNKIREYLLKLDSNQWTSEDVEKYSKANKESDALVARQDKAREMLQEANQEVLNHLELTIRSGSIGGYENFPIRPIALDNHPDLANIQRIVGEVSKMIGGADQLNSVGIGIESHPRGVPQRDYFSPSENKIVISDTARPNIVFHEMGHWYERNLPGGTLAAQSFLENRTHGEKAETLNDLRAKMLGDPLGTKYGYQDYEIAKPDKFRDNYVGKLYPNATEVTSMGFQYLYENPMQFYHEDRDHFYFTLGMIRAGRKGGFK